MSENNTETRSVAPAPPSALGHAEDEARKNKQYELEKKMGRRLPSGKWKLSRLTPRHLRMIGAHLNGESNKEIAEHFGVHEMTVGRVLRDPLTEAYIEDARENYDLEVKGLIGLAIVAVRDSLRAGDTELRLKGVDKLEKLNRMLNPDAVLAERIDPDSAARVDDAREKFLNVIEKLADKFAPILAGEATEGKTDGNANGDGVSGDADFTIEGEGRDITPASKDEYVAISGPDAGTGSKGSPK